MGEACCLRLMQADGMNDNLSGNPAMPPPTGTTVPDREGITDRHPSAHPRSRNGNHRLASLCPHRSRNVNHKQAPLCLLPKTTDIARQLSRLPWRYFFYIRV